MKDALGIVVGVVITLVALVMCINGTFVPFRENQALISTTNSSLMTSLQSEMNTSVSDLTVTGASIISLIDASVDNPDIEIYVGSTKWDGKRYSSSNIVVNDSDEYVRKTRSSGSTTIYEFSKK